MFKKYDKELTWVRKSMENNSGQASSRKLTAFVGMIMLIVTWIADLFFDKTIAEPLLYGILTMTGLSFGLFTAENVVQILKRNNYNDIFQQGNIGNFDTSNDSME